MNSDQRRRLFIALEWRPGRAITALLQDLRELSGRSCPGLRPVHPENLHVTLRFLGMVPKADIVLLRQLMDQVIPSTPGFELRLSSIGCFRNALWLGVQASEALSELVDRLNQSLTVMGLPVDGKPYLPHVTVARLRPDTRLKISALQEKYRNRSWGRLQVDAVHLYESTTLPEGARYSKLYTVPLFR